MSVPYRKAYDSFIGETYFDKYTLIEKIGEGSFGMIYKAESQDGLVAFKFEKIRSGKLSLLEPEAEIMSYLKGQGIPKIIRYFSGVEYNIMIMELLGPSLEQLAKKEKDNKLSLKTVCMLGIEMIKILRHIHNKHIIHRDIKPDNFGVGNIDRDKLYLFDFGLAKKYRSSHTLKQSPMKGGKKLTGTARYASMNALRGFDQSRRDDLESVGYVLMYLLKGNLPWQGITIRTKDEKYAKILKIKENTSPELLCSEYPNELSEFVKYTRGLEYEEEPKYDYLIELLSNVITNNLKEQIDYKYDWFKNSEINKIKIIEDYIEDEKHSESSDRAVKAEDDKDGIRQIITAIKDIKNLEDDDNEDDKTKKKGGQCCIIF